MKLKNSSPLFWIFFLSISFFAVFMLLVRSGTMEAPKTVASKPFRTGGLFGMKSPLVEGNQAIAVIEVNGAIMNSKKILEDIRWAKQEEAVKGIIVRIDSPGGAVGPSQEIYDALVEVGKTKPVYASMGAITASGGFYIAMGANTIFANPGTLTGSIGVIMSFANLEKLYEWAKIERYSITTGKYKDTGADYKKMTAEERKLLQTMIDDVLSQFKKAILDSRTQIREEELDQVADGRIFSGRQARDLGFVDELGSFDKVVETMAKALKIEGEPELVYPKKRRQDFWMELVGGGDPEDSASTGLVGVFQRLLGVSVQKNMPLFSQPGIYMIWDGSRL